MILYRVLSKYELNMLNGLEPGNPPETLRGNNSFKYEKGQEYMHFFKYAEHAQKHKSKFGICIAKLDIPDELINQYGFGYYGGLGDLAPECIIKKEDFSKKFIIEIEKNIKPEWALINDTQVTYNQLYEVFIENMKKEYYRNHYSQYTSANTYISSTVDVRKLDYILLQNLNNEKRSTH